MSRFLLAVWSFDTHVNPFLAVAAALRKEGHQVAFYAGPRASIEIAEQGFRFFPFQSLSEEIADRHVAGIVRDRKDPRKLRVHWKKFLVSQLPEQVEDLNRIVTAWQPDVLIADMAMLAPFTVLQDQGRVPIAILSHVGYCMYPGMEGPIPGIAIPPRRSVVDHWKASLLLRLTSLITRSIPVAIDAVRQQFGLPPLGLRVIEYHARVPLLLIPSVPELDYNRSDLPQSVRYIGKCIWPPPEHSNSGVSPCRTRIVVDEGSFYAEEPILLRSAVEGLGNSSYDVRVICGRHRDPARLNLGPPAPNVKMLPWCPVDDVLGGASLLITNGNTESVLSALIRGIPVMVVPAILDQAEIGWRVRVFGAGDFLKESRCTPRNLRKMAQSILTEARYSLRASQASSFLARHPSPAEATRLLEQLAYSRELILD